MRGCPAFQVGDRSRDAPARMRTATSRGYSLAYEDVGEGPVIVLVPGSGSTSADWRDAGYVARLQAAGRQVLAIDPLGLGLSDRPHDPAAYTYPDVAADVTAVMDAAGVARAAIWGYSRGASVAGSVAMSFPERASALIVGGEDITYRFEPGSAPGPESEQLMRGDLEPLLDAYTWSEPARDWIKTFIDPVAIGAMSLGVRLGGLAIEPSLVRAPVLMYAGAEDRPEDMRVTADAFGIDLHLLPGLDHMTAFSAVDEVTSLVLAFLDLHGR